MNGYLDSSNVRMVPTVQDPNERRACIANNHANTLTVASNVFFLKSKVVSLVLTRASSAT